MSVTALTERQKTLIVSNVVKAVKNIDNLNKTGYNFLYQCSGFIAHYDMYGFVANYSDGRLVEDIVSYAGQNQWKNFRPGESNYEYYMSRADIYNRIIKEIM